MPLQNLITGPASVARVLAGAVLLIVLATFATAQEDAPALMVGVHDSPPFVLSEDDEFRGFAIDLWEKVADKLGYEFTYREFDTVREMLDATTTGEIDIAISNLTITEERAARFDFTQPWYDSGLRVMVADSAGSDFWALVMGLKESGFLEAYLWLAFAIILASVGFTLFDRKFDKGFPTAFRDGFAESFYTVMTVATSGKPPKRKNLFGWLGRMWQGLWLVFGVVTVAFVTSSVTSVMTTTSLQNNIRSVADLPGLDVGVVDGSTAEVYARSNGLNTIPFPRLKDAAEALLDGEVHALIGDKPVLEYYHQTHSGEPLSVVGAVFNPEKYGFGLTANSPYRKDITVEVVGAREDGTLFDLNILYFGSNP